MKRTLYGLTLTLLLLVGLPRVSHAQQNGSVRVQQDPTMLHACTSTNSTGAVNATFATITLTPPAGQFVYVCGVDIAVSFDATGGTASTNVAFTSTNLGGWQWKMSWAGTASTTLTQPFYFSQPTKSVIPGTAVTFVSPAANLHGAYSVNVYYFFAQ
jgi:hypothetical protein